MIRRIAALALIAGVGIGATPHPTASPRLVRSHAAAAKNAAVAQRPVFVTSTLASRLLRSPSIASDLERLTDEVGGRPSGTPALERAVHFALERFHDAGIPDAHVDAYRAARAFIPSVETAEISNASHEATDQNRRFRVAQMPMSPPTPSDGLEAEVVDGGNGNAAAFARVRKRIAHHWVLVHSEAVRTLAQRSAVAATDDVAFNIAHAYGAAGILFIASHGDRLLSRVPARIDGAVATLPAAIVEREGGERIARLLARGYSVRLRVTLLGRSPADVESQNVSAEIHGTALRSEHVVLVAHLDSWDIGRGAQDDGANVAVVFAVARELRRLAKSGIRPRRTVTFLLSTGEREGMFGSLADVRAHRRDLNDRRAQIAIDIGGTLTGFSLGGRTDLEPVVAAALAPVRGLGPASITRNPIVPGDGFDAFIEGIPTIVGDHDGARDVADDADTYEKIDPAELRRSAAIVGTLVWGIANAATLPPRLSRTQVERLVKTTPLRSQMEAFGLWEPFVRGVRGRMFDRVRTHGT